MKKAIIFDMDGLMIDSERLYFQVEREIVEKFDKTFREEVLWKMMGRKPIESIKLFVEEFDLPAAPEEMLNMRNNMMREKLQNDLLPMPGLESIIDTFYGKMKLAVATGAQQEFLDIAVDRLGLRDKFDVLLSSDLIEKGKPDPEMYLTACGKLNLDPGLCVVLEDSSNGARAGKRAGCYVIAVPSEYTKEQDFSFVDFSARDLFQAEEHIRAQQFFF
ncbi:MAG: HAD family phosphatase [Candidatus Aminicenantes bacterium]|nr:HAD family phosphatase [Candidatus Aminicenantes bacterium]